MASTREMQNRMRTVESIGQLTRALQAVSASQVKTYKEISENTLPYTTLAWQVLTDLYHEAEFYKQHRAFKSPDPTQPIDVGFISADRGLAGSFPINVIRETIKLEKEATAPVRYITIGKKGRDMLKRRNKTIVADFSGFSTATSFHDIRSLSNMIMDDFTDEKTGQVFMIFTEYESISHFRPITRQLLPFIDRYQSSMTEKLMAGVHKGRCIYEGDPDVIMRSLMTRYLRMELFHGIASSKASEHTSRMLAMNQASENSEELLASLHIEYNKVRQESITNDILDIMGGSIAHNE